MIKPERFKAPWIAPSDIRKIVEGLRAKYPVCAQLPVEILSFAEHDLHLEFDFKPIAQFGQDAFLLHDFSGIVFDDHAFDARNQNRLRFSVAHELGHFYLHRDIYGKVGFTSVQQWIDFIDRVPPAQYQKIEWQADEFAGQLLMPLQVLTLAFHEALADAKREGYFPLGRDAVLDFCCNAIHKDFGVSRPAIRTRVHHDKLWPDASVPDVPEGQA